MKLLLLLLLPLPRPPGEPDRDLPPAPTEPPGEPLRLLPRLLLLVPRSACRSPCTPRSLCMTRPRPLPVALMIFSYTAAGSASGCACASAAAAAVAAAADKGAAELGRPCGDAADIAADVASAMAVLARERPGPPSLVADRPLAVKPRALLTRLLRGCDCGGARPSDCGERPPRRNDGTAERATPMAASLPAAGPDGEELEVEPKSPDSATDRVLGIALRAGVAAPAASGEADEARLAAVAAAEAAAAARAAAAGPAGGARYEPGASPVTAASAAAMPSAVRREVPGVLGACEREPGANLCDMSLEETVAVANCRGEGAPPERGEGTVKPGGAMRTDPDRVRGLLAEGLPLNCNRSAPSSKFATKSTTSEWSPILNIFLQASSYEKLRAWDTRGCAGRLKRRKR